MPLNTTPRTWLTGDFVTASLMNTELRDALIGLQAAWTAYTPAWTATTAPALGNGSLAGRWNRSGKSVDVWLKLTIGSTTTQGTGGWAFSLPVAARDTTTGTGITSTAKPLICRINTTTCNAYDSAAGTVITNTSGLVSGSTLILTASYEAA